MIRTVALLLMFAWLANAGARLGTVALAANQVLLQVIGLVAFVLDGFAFTAESRVGQAIGARSRPDLIRAIRLTGEFSLGVATIACLLIVTTGTAGIALLVTNQAVRDTANMILPFVAILPLLGMPAWLLDGIFIGATGGRALRNAAVLATALYIGTDLLLRPLGLWGLWTAFLIAYVYRGAALGAYLPGLLRSLSAPTAPLAKSES
jgi:MATE family multidrug resistance protein